MGLAIAILLASTVLAGLWWTVRSRVAVELIGAALLLGCAGYAWQGHPTLGGSATSSRPKPPAAGGFAAERADWLPQVGAEAQVLDAADGLIRSGDADYAAGIIHAQLARAPNSEMLWLGLANALVVYADGQVTPAARFAFARAASVGGSAPAPRYFLGLALAESGDIDGADRQWRDLLVHGPAGGAWRARVEQKLDVIAYLRRQM